jgi:hypothetical protein
VITSLCRAVVALLAVLTFSVSAACGHRAAKPVAEEHCPNLVGETLKNETPAGLAARGAADGLPSDGATRRERVASAVRLNAAYLRRQYPGIRLIDVGPGLGWTYSSPADNPAAYHRVADFQVIVHLRTQSNCPHMDAMVPNDHGERVPVLFVYRSR